MFRKLMAFAMAAIVGFASCSKEDNGPGVNDDTQSISLQISQPAARSIDPGLGGAGAQDLVTFANGDLFLCSSSGQIISKFTFVSGATPTNQASKIINIADVTGGNSLTLLNIKATVVSAYIVGNTTNISGYATAAMENKYISGVKALTLTPAVQYSSTKKNLADVTLFGDGQIVADGSPDGSGDPANEKKYVEIVLRPHVARLEISDITAGITPAPGLVSVLTYDVAGIFINNFYPSISVDWTTPGTIVNPGQGNTNFYDNGVGAYVSAMNNILFDYSATFFGNTNTALVKYPNGSNNSAVWAYNLLAAPVFGTGAFATATTVAPHIIVKMQGITASNGEDYSGVKYLTVNKLFLNGTTTEITHFEAGKVYTIEPGQFVFTLDNAHDDAETGFIDLRVKVSVMQWTTVAMTPGLQ